VVVVVVVVTTVVCVAGAKENWPSVLSAPNCAMVETRRSLLCSLGSVIDGAGNLEAKGGLMASFGAVF
jgi:hypothetical protein